METGDSWRNRQIFAYLSISSLFRLQLCLNCSGSLPRSSSPTWIAVTSSLGQGWRERGRLPVYVDPSQAWSRKGKHGRLKKCSQPANCATKAGFLFPKDRNLLPTFLLYGREHNLGCEKWSAYVFPALHLFAPCECAAKSFCHRMDQPRPFSSTHNRASRQLWIRGMQQSAASCSTVSEEMFGGKPLLYHWFPVEMCLYEKLNSSTISSCYLFLSTGRFSAVWYRLDRTFNWWKTWWATAVWWRGCWSTSHSYDGSTQDTVDFRGN